MNKVLIALKKAFPDTEAGRLTDQLRFEDVPGWDSMSSVSFLVELESEVGVQLSDIPLSGSMSVKELSALLEVRGISLA